jgi:hypothetical protein
MKCLVERNVIELVKVEKAITLDVAIKSKKNYIYRKENEELAIRTITGILLMFSEYYNLSQQMTEMQAVQTASLFLEQYPAESIEDLILCLKKAKIGEYGKIYNRIDGGMIFEWFNKYLDEKYERFEQIKQNEKFEVSESNILSLPEKTLELIGQIAKDKIQETPKQDNVERINDLKHFEAFKKSVTKITKPNLIHLREHYVHANKTTMYSNYNHYIEVIDEQLKNL